MPQSLALPLGFGFKDWFASRPRSSMEFHAAGRALHVEGNQHLKLHDAAGTLVQVVCGTAWITQEGDIKDSFLKSGECLRIAHQGVTLVSPLGSVSLRVIGAATPHEEAALSLLPAGASRRL